MSALSLEGLRMNAIQTAPNGVVGRETIFHFRQQGEHVQASYAGGRVEQGFLLGIARGPRLEFTYCQRHTDGSLDAGRSQCELRREGGRLQIVEHFEWGGGRGTNVIQELPESDGDPAR